MFFRSRFVSCTRESSFRRTGTAVYCRNTQVPKGAKTAWKFLCFAQSYPIYSGGSTGLTDFFGVVVSPSISQRNCCLVRERTSSGPRGH